MDAKSINLASQDFAYPAGGRDVANKVKRLGEKTQLFWYQVDCRRVISCIDLLYQTLLLPVDY